MELAQEACLRTTDTKHRGAARMQRGMFGGRHTPFCDAHRGEQRFDRALHVVEREGPRWIEMRVWLQPTGLPGADDATPGENDCYSATLVGELIGAGAEHGAA